MIIMKKNWRRNEHKYLDSNKFCRFFRSSLLFILICCDFFGTSNTFDSLRLRHIWSFCSNRIRHKFHSHSQANSKLSQEVCSLRACLFYCECWTFRNRMAFYGVIVQQSGEKRSAKWTICSILIQLKLFVAHFAGLREKILLN